jgi:hypothetical protein
MSRWKSWLLVWVALGSTVLIGCGDGGSVAVAGKVSLDGQALKGASITFTSTTSEPGRLEGVFVGVTDQQGQFSLRPASPTGGRTPPGKYLVSITTTYVEGGTPDYEAPPPERVPAKYRKGIEFNVPEGGIADANFDLKSK